VGNIAKETSKKVFKVLITDLDELKQRLRMEWAQLDHVVIAADIRRWRRQLVSKSRSVTL